MRQLTRYLSLGTMSLAIVFGGLSAANAQEATPEVDISPNPDECQLERRTLEELQAIYIEAHPEGAGEATSAAQIPPVNFTMPEGEPADEETIEAITQAIRQQMACHAAGDYLAGFSGVTDEFLESQVGVSLFDEDMIAFLEADPQPLAEEDQTQFLGARNVTVLEDGRVAALVDYHSPTPQPEGIDGVETDLWIFKNVDGQWLLDESIEHLEGTHGPEGIATPGATPAA